MSDAFVGEIRMFAGNFPPKNWAFCNGQLMAISQNTALFSILGTYYGGDGKSTFALPNLNGRAPLHQGQGVGLTNRVIGESGGAQQVTLLTSQLPAHTHQAYSLDAPGNTNNPEGAVWAQTPMQGKINKTQTPFYASAATDYLSAGALPTVGMGLPHNNRQPYLGVSFIICLNGIYPARS